MTGKQALRGGLILLALAASAFVGAGQESADKLQKPVTGIDTGIHANPRGTTSDPRYGLKPGLYDAGEAILGMQRIGSLPKPQGFAPGSAAVQVPAGPGGGQYGSWNTDLAFSGSHLFIGNYNGISFYDIDSPSQIKLTTTLICPGGQGDVSVYGHLLFMSAESLNARTDCGAQGIPPPPGYVPPPPPPAPPAAPGAPPARPPRPIPPPSPDRFRGVRIFDISDLANPKQVAAVQSCRGSHTHTLLVDPKDKDNIYVYISGTGNVRQTEEMAECTAGDPVKNPDTALFRIDIIKVPLAHPEQAKIVSSPRIFSDPKTGAINGLWKGGNYGEGSQSSSETSRCHDVTVYPAIGLAAGACSGNGILLDISNPVNPVRLDAVSDPNYAFWHSATFNNAGTKVLFTDEWGGGIQPRCRGTDPMSWGADALFTLSPKHKLTAASYYKMPVPQPEDVNCVAHNGSLIPVPGRDIMVQSWYSGGISILDFTDVAHPVEIAYFSRGPVEKGKIVMSGVWSAYWFNGFIYSSEIARGVDVFKLVPSDFLTQNEIDAANQVHFDELNVQNQPKINWPSNFIVARAYMDQLNRDGALAPQRIAALNAAIARVDVANPDRKEVARLREIGVSLGKQASLAKSPADAERMRALAAIVKDRTAGT
jgi:hypothetical protein